MANPAGENLINSRSMSHVSYGLIIFCMFSYPESTYLTQVNYFKNAYPDSLITD